MNPALLLVLFGLGTMLILGGAMGWIFGSLPMALGLTLVVLGSVLESIAVVLYARQRAGR